MVSVVRRGKGAWTLPVRGRCVNEGLKWSRVFRDGSVSQVM